MSHLPVINVTCSPAAAGRQGRGSVAHRACGATKKIINEYDRHKRQLITCIGKQWTEDITCIAKQWTEDIGRVKHVFNIDTDRNTLIIIKYLANKSSADHHNC